MTVVDTSTPLAANIWTWYGQDQYRWIVLVAELGPVLEFLAATAQRQRVDIGCCAECNLWSEQLEYLERFVQQFPPRLAPLLHSKLQALLSGGEALSREAYGMTLEDNGFEHPQWQPLREGAREALELLGWSQVREDIGELAEECRAALIKWRE
ncbi:hypothetical protein J4P02_11670 [Pseudomonas sp. NFXW11]